MNERGRQALSGSLTAALFLGALASASTAQWLGPEGRSLPFEEPEEVVAFLEEAEVLESDRIESGSTKPSKVLLEHEGVRAHGVFRSADRSWRLARVEGRELRHFRDSAFHECAAYRLSRILGMDSVPPCVERRLLGRKGTLQIWVEEAMTEKKRQEEAIEPPIPAVWMRQRQEMLLFDVLIDNVDRNLGNMLIGPEWKIWLIDHSRGFTEAREVPRLKGLIWVGRSRWERLRDLDRETLHDELRPALELEQIEAILYRRDRIVDHLDEKIAELGESAVVLPDVWTDAGSHLELPTVPLEEEIPAESTPVEILGEELPSESAPVEVLEDQLPGESAPVEALEEKRESASPPDDPES